MVRCRLPLGARCSTRRPRSRRCGGPSLAKKRFRRGRRVRRNLYRGRSSAFLGVAKDAGCDARTPKARGRPQKARRVPQSRQPPWFTVLRLTQMDDHAGGLPAPWSGPRIACHGHLASSRWWGAQRVGTVICVRERPRAAPGTGGAPRRERKRRTLIAWPHWGQLLALLISIAICVIWILLSLRYGGNGGGG